MHGSRLGRRRLLEIEDLLPSPGAGTELPEEQREAFVAHVLAGQSFKEMAAETALSY